jgi:hypothetical protein
MTPDELFQLADRLAEKPRQWVESGPAADGASSCVMFLGFERALRQYSAIVELLRRGLCDDALVLVRSLYELNEPAHFHAIYGEYEALIEIETLLVFRGSLPRRALALVLEWAAMHRVELRDDWQRAPPEKL